MQSKAMQSNARQSDESNADECRQGDTKQGTALRGKAKKLQIAKQSRQSGTPETVKCDTFVYLLPKILGSAFLKKGISLIGVTPGSFQYKRVTMTV